MRWEDYTVRVLISALVVTSMFTLWMIWELADLTLPGLTQSAIAQDSTGGTTADTTDATSQETTGDDTTTDQSTTQSAGEETTTEETTTQRRESLQNSGGLRARAVPPMPGKGCPKEFPKEHRRACYPK